MSQDRVIGIAVLDEEERQLLIICGTHRNSRCEVCSIPVYEPAKGQLKETNQGWMITRVGDKLVVQPSVKSYLPAVIENGKTIMPETELFHNDGSWSVKFVTFDKQTFKYRYDHWKQLNQEFIEAWRRGERNL